MSKYVVVKLINPEMDACAHHPSGIATMGDGGDLWPVDAEIVSKPYVDYDAARGVLEAKLTELFLEVSQSCCGEWAAFEFDGCGRTITVNKVDDDFRPRGEGKWVYKFLVVELPEYFFEPA